MSTLAGARRITPVACVVLLAVQVLLPVNAGSKRRGPARPFVLARPDHSKGHPPGAVDLELDGQGYRKLLAGRPVVIEDFPLPGQVPVKLELTPFEVLSPNARLVVVDEDGERAVPRPLFHAFRGKVAGDPDSRVTLSAFEGRLAGSIRTWYDEFVIAPHRFNLARQGARDIRVWSRSHDPDPPESPPCEAEALTYPSIPQVPAGPTNSAAGAPATTSIDGGTLLRAEVAIDATYEWFDHFGSVSAAQNYILNLMAQVSTIYENEVLVQLEVPFMRIFTTPQDPYTDTTDTSVLLGELRSEWNANQVETPRTVAHLFSVRPSGGAGRAYLDSLCSNNHQPGNSYDYGVSTLSANGGSWEKNLVAHEIGHNFSSPHTHCFIPEIDQCANQSGCYQGPMAQTTGTIMSYCNQVASSFHARVEDEQIRPAAEAAFPTCVFTAGLPGRLMGSDGLRLSRPNSCPTASLQNDDGSTNFYYGYGGTSQMAWIKRLTPSCYPFLLERVEVLIGHASSVAPGRALRLLVYTDPEGTGDPAAASLVHSEDVTVQTVSNGVFNQYELAVPQTLSSGDYYIGFYDLVQDQPNTYIANVDDSGSGDSYRTSNSTSPQDFAAYSSGSWMIRGGGGPVGPAGLLLDWGASCNDATTPAQDFGVYRGAIGEFTDFSTLTCTTGRESHYLAVGVSDDSFFLVVPNTSANEGSYGVDGAGAQRQPAVLQCKPQSAAGCS